MFYPMPEEVPHRYLFSAEDPGTRLLCDLYSHMDYLIQRSSLNVIGYCACSQESQNHHNLVFSGCLMVKTSIKVINYNRIAWLQVTRIIFFRLLFGGEYPGHF